MKKGGDELDRVGFYLEITFDMKLESKDLGVDRIQLSI